MPLKLFLHFMFPSQWVFACYANHELSSSDCACETVWNVTFSDLVVYSVIFLQLVASHDVQRFRALSLRMLSEGFGVLSTFSWQIVLEVKGYGLLERRYILLLGSFPCFILSYRTIRLASQRIRGLHFCTVGRMETSLG